MSRDEIARLCAEHDRFLAECVSEQPVRALVRKSDAGAGLIFKTVEDALQAPQLDGAAASSDETLALFALDQFSQACVERFKMLDRENIRLRAQLDGRVATPRTPEIIQAKEARCIAAILSVSTTQPRLPGRVSNSPRR
jgi:hypothetical protein